MTIVSRGQTYIVSSGRTETGDIVLSGGTLNVVFGATASSTQAFGNENVYGQDISAVVDSDHIDYVASQTVDAGGTAIGTLIKIGFQNILSGNLVIVELTVRACSMASRSVTKPCKISTLS